MRAIAIRPAVLSDLDAIERLERQVFSGDLLSRRSLRAFIQAPHRPLLLASDEAGLAGYALVVLPRGGRVARLYSIAVDPGRARRGVGRALVAAAQTYALEQGRQALRLEVREDNHPAVALYERLGYRRFGWHDDFYADGAAALRLEKRLVAT
jgi:[ribosomal protein S18]-alanine N-acetyltransferase